MKAIRRDGPGNMKLVDIDPPQPGADEVLIRVSYAGICGSDIHRFLDPDPKWDSMVLGHEFSGTVRDVGADSDKSLIGSRVSVAPLVPCHKCSYCQRGWYSQCAGYSFIGSRRNGAFAEWVTVPAKNLVFLPDNLSLKPSALLEPITVVLHPLMMVKNQLGQIETAVVMGLGTIGLLAIQVFRFMGARNIVACDVVPEKIQLALRVGATLGVDARDERIESVTDDLGGANVVFESSGSAAGKKAGIRAAGSRGIVLLVGTSPNDVSMEAELFERVTRKEISIVGSWMNYSAPWPGDEWKTAAWLLANGLIDEKPLITHQFDLTSGPEAFALIRHGSEPFVKVLIGVKERE